MSSSSDPAFKHFDSTWASTLLSNPNIKTFTPPCRLPPGSPGRAALSKDQFMRNTLNDPRVIPHALGLYTDPFASSSTFSSQDRKLISGEITLLFDLREGVKGFNGGAHGGLMMVPMDETMATLFFINTELYTAFHNPSSPSFAKPAFLSGIMDLGSKANVTVGINDVRFLKALPAPSVVAVVARLEKVEGRKRFVKCEIRGEGGVVYASCEGVFVGVDRTNSKDKKL